MTLTPDGLKEWGWAVCVSLFFASCGIAALSEVITDAIRASRCGQVAP